MAAAAAAAAAVAVDVADDDIKQLRADRVKGLLAALDYAEDVDTVQGILTVVPPEVEFVHVRKQAEIKLKQLSNDNGSSTATASASGNHNDAIFKKIISQSTS